MLKVHFFDVGHGDSIVLEFRYRDAEGIEKRSFGVMDSNVPSGGSVAALEFLREQGATELSFVALTHPHTDHHLGLPEICDFFEGRIHAVYTFPINRSREKIAKLARHFHSFTSTSRDEVVARNGVSFIKFLAAVKGHENWQDPSGPAGDIPVEGFPGVSFKFLLPPSSVRGQVVEQLAEGQLPPDARNLNEMSMAWLVEYAGRQVVLGGDGTSLNWISQQRGWRNLPNLRIDPIAVKLPHHGSHHDCSDDILGILFPEPANNGEEARQRYAIVSANGKTHPSHDVLRYLATRNIKPYCTRLSTLCHDTAPQLPDLGQGIDPELRIFVETAAVNSVPGAQCQGTVTLTINPDGQYLMTSETSALCPFRGDYDFIEPLAPPIA